MWITTVTYQLPAGETFEHHRNIIQSIAEKAAELGRVNNDGLPVTSHSPVYIDPKSGYGVAKRRWTDQSTANSFTEYVSSTCHFATVTVEEE